MGIDPPKDVYAISSSYKNRFVGNYDELFHKPNYE